MIEQAVVAARLLQYAGASVLFGLAWFCLYALPATGPVSAVGARWPRPVLQAAAVLLALGAAGGLLAQTAMMAGSWAEGLKAGSLGVVITGTGLGRAGLIRTLAALLALAALLVVRPGPALWRVTALLGALACASLAWMGHAAAAEGPGAPLHLASDVLHALAAGAWIGALAGFLALLRSPLQTTTAAAAAAHAALARFAGRGSAVVAVLVLTGLANSWFLVGPDRLAALWTTAYGRLLLLKLGLFCAMLALAAANRMRLTPRLGAELDRNASPGIALARLKQSLVWETGLGLTVLAVVAWLGTLPPPAAG
ncbi:copper homeostasis membrane protein CopD [Phenylobacterium sp. LH3H17]|uniref:copper homeostasis membrane protein CopD n=1 Tax=Phenylobacterium sp. LH3H17 TaxID=2903901 RepID=UPI0020C9DA3C|nr:copper homeostasis membrane protein CopD [Phenylobacterium sp. LH3H17]UTP38222.1 copper homeostasis membrane protein CopD [Phenylobacterium sp. LH3H17]